MEITLSSENGTPTIVLDGLLTGWENSRAVFEKITGLFNDRNEKLILDIRKVGYIDSSGLGALVDLHCTYKSIGKKICLLGPLDHIKQLFLDTHLHEIFEIVDVD